MIRIRVGVLAIRGGKALVVCHRHRDGREPFYLLPGGVLEEGETILSCAEREVREETFTEVKARRIFAVGELVERARHTLDVFVLADWVRGEPRPGTDPERPADGQVLTEARFVSIAELAKLRFLPPEILPHLPDAVASTDSFAGLGAYSGRSSPEGQ